MKPITGCGRSICAPGYYDHPARYRLADPRRYHAFRRHAFSACGSRAVLLSAGKLVCLEERAALILKDADRAALAALLFNLTLMISAELLAATPDMRSWLPPVRPLCIFWPRCSKAVMGAGGWLWALAARPGAAVEIFRAVSWAGDTVLAAGGVGASASGWRQSGPIWARAVALLIWTPHLLWQAQHGWMTFRLPVRACGRRRVHAEISG